MKLRDSSLTKLAQFDGVNSGQFPLGALVNFQGCDMRRSRCADTPHNGCPFSRHCPLGFGPETIRIAASRWAPLSAVPGTHRLDLTKGGLEDNEPNNFPAQFKFTLANTSTGVAKTVIASTNLPEKTAFTANFKTGAFSGTFAHPDIGATKPRGFSGVLYQKQNTGIGVFLGTSTSGPVQIDLQ